MNTNQTMTNFQHHFYRAQAEMMPKTIQARKLLFEADRSRDEQAKALADYEEGFRLWREVLQELDRAALASEDTAALAVAMSAFRADAQAQEAVYEQMLRYVDLWQDYHGPRVAVQVANTVAVDLAANTLPVPPVLLFGQLDLSDPKKPVVNPIGPITALDGVDERGNRWINAATIATVTSRLPAAKPQPAPPRPTPAAGGQP